MLTRFRPVRVLVAFLITCGLPFTADADLVVNGDAEVEVLDDGAVFDLFIDDNIAPIYDNYHFLTIDGSAPLPFYSSEFTSSGVMVDGNMASIDLLYNNGTADILEIEIQVVLNNELDGDNYASVDLMLNYTNISDSAVDIQYYPYFDLDGFDYESDTANFDGTRIIQQTDGYDGDWVIEFVSQGDVDHWEIAPLFELYDKLDTEDQPFDLIDGTNGLVDDLEVAFQYNRSIGVGESESIAFRVGTASPAAIPEPSHWKALCFLTFIGLILYRRRSPADKSSE